MFSLKPSSFLFLSVLTFGNLKREAIRESVDLLLLVLEVALTQEAERSGSSDGTWRDDVVIAEAVESDFSERIGRLSKIAADIFEV
jgi:hypothetical protein